MELEVLDLFQLKKAIRIIIPDFSFCDILDPIRENVPAEVPLSILVDLVNDKLDSVGDGNYIFYANDDDENIGLDDEKMDQKLIDVLKGYEDEPNTYEIRCFLINALLECIPTCDNRLYFRNATNINLMAKLEYTVVYVEKEPDIW